MVVKRRITRSKTASEHLRCNIQVSNVTYAKLGKVGERNRSHLLIMKLCRVLQAVGLVVDIIASSVENVNNMFVVI